MELVENLSFNVQKKEEACRISILFDIFVNKKSKTTKKVYIKQIRRYNRGKDTYTGGGIMVLDKLAESISQYPDRKELSEKTDIDEELLDKIAGGETSLILNDREIERASDFLGVNEKPIVLPGYLSKSIEDFLEGWKNDSSLLDCLWMDLYSSINIAQIDDGILSKEEADFLRNKYLWSENPCDE